MIIFVTYLKIDILSILVNFEILEVGLEEKKNLSSFQFLYVVFFFFFYVLYCCHYLTSSCVESVTPSYILFLLFFLDNNFNNSFYRQNSTIF